jgi:Type II intron maturase
MRTLPRTRHKSLESPVPGKRARRVWREAARKRPGFTLTEPGTSLGSPPYPSSTPAPRSPQAAGRSTGRSRCWSRRDVIKAQSARYRQRGEPSHRPRLQNLHDYDIVRKYGAEYAGIVSYYLLARDVYRLNTLRWNAETSMLKTLGRKHRSSVAKMAARYKAKTETSDGLRTCFEARRHHEGKPDLVARFGGIPLRQDRRAVIRDPVPAPAPYPRKELITRLRKRECELCEAGTTVAVHQVTGLKALGRPGPGQPAWASLMAKMHRKTLIVCAACHNWIHANPVAHAA